MSVPLVHGEAGGDWGRGGEERGERRAFDPGHMYNHLFLCVVLPGFNSLFIHYLINVVDVVTAKPGLDSRLLPLVSVPPEVPSFHNAQTESRARRWPHRFSSPTADPTESARPRKLVALGFLVSAQKDVAACNSHLPPLQPSGDSQADDLCWSVSPLSVGVAASLV